MKVAVIGAGTMGSGIAQTFAQAESVEKVYLCDIKTEFAEGGFAKIKKGLDKQVAKGKKTREEADKITGFRITSLRILIASLHQTHHLFQSQRSDQDLQSPSSVCTSSILLLL